MSTTRRRTTRLVATGALAAAFVLPAATATAAAPDNDLFADATTITALPYEDEIDTTEATTGEPEDLLAKDACGSPPFDSELPPDATVWFELSLANAAPEFIVISAAPPLFVTPGFNVVVESPEGFECVAGGPVEVGFLAEPGVTYYVQSIDDQLPEDPDAPLDTTNGGTLALRIESLGTPAPDICPGIGPDDPRLPPGLNMIVGTDGNDSIVGTDGNDLIFGLDGDDEINGRGGDDIIFGCGGDDDINGGDGDDFIVGDSADFFGDPSSTNGGDDQINGGDGDDEIRGGPGDDDINGGKGDDAIFANQGDDSVQGGQGDDFVVGGFGEDDVHGGQGNDGVFGGFDSDTVHGGPGDDVVDGDAPAPFPDETDHTDICNGGPGDDEVSRCERVNGKP